VFLQIFGITNDRRSNCCRCAIASAFWTRIGRHSHPPKCVPNHVFVYPVPSSHQMASILVAVSVAGHRAFGVAWHIRRRLPTCGFHSNVCSQSLSSLSSPSVLLAVSVLTIVLRIETIRAVFKPLKLVTLPIFCYF
jgi:hypothetical protein